MIVTNVVAGILALAAVPTAEGRKMVGEAGRLPVMGWTTWDKHIRSCHRMRSSVVFRSAKALIDRGLADIGYNHLNVDDCGFVDEFRNQTNSRLMVNNHKFPEGYGKMAKALHLMGLKVGLHLLVGRWGKGGYQNDPGHPGSIGYELIDADMLREWEIDHLKYDTFHTWGTHPEDLPSCISCDPEFIQGINGSCHHEKTWPSKGKLPACPPHFDYTTSAHYRHYETMANALLYLNHSITYNIANQGYQGVQGPNGWGHTLGQSWRVAKQDFRNVHGHKPSWGRVAKDWNIMAHSLDHVDFYSHVDGDILENGHGFLTFSEQRTQFAAWAIMKSPLMLSFWKFWSHKAMGDKHLDVVKTPVLIRFNQDPVFGKPARPYKWGTHVDGTFDQRFPPEYWSGTFNDYDLQNKTLAMIHNPSPDFWQDRIFNFTEIPQLDNTKLYELTDGWTDRKLGCFKGSFTARVEPHDSAVIYFAEAPGCYLSADSIDQRPAIPEAPSWDAVNGKPMRRSKRGEAEGDPRDEVEDPLAQDYEDEQDEKEVTMEDLKPYFRQDMIEKYGAL